MPSNERDLHKRYHVEYFSDAAFLITIPMIKYSDVPLCWALAALKCQNCSIYSWLSKNMRPDTSFILLVVGFGWVLHKQTNSCWSFPVFNKNWAWSIIWLFIIDILSKVVIKHYVGWHAVWSIGSQWLAKYMLLDNKYTKKMQTSNYWRNLFIWVVFLFGL